MTEDSARLIKLEMTVERYGELLQRSIGYMEQQTEINARFVGHIEDNRRVWKLLEDHDKRLDTIQIQNAEVCTFCNTARKVAWGIAIFASGGLAYLIKFFFDHHAKVS